MRFWTDKEIYRLEELRLDGRTVAQIATALDRSVSAIKQKLSDEGIYRANYGVKRYLEVLQRPHTLQGAASQLGVTRSAVRNAKWELRRMGYEVMTASDRNGAIKRPWTKEVLEYIRANYKKVPTREIARHVGRTVKHVINVVHRLKLMDGVETFPEGERHE